MPPASCPRHRFKLGLFVGLGIGAFGAGGALYFWRRRKKDGLEGLGAAPSAAAVPFPMPMPSMPSAPEIVAPHPATRSDDAFIEPLELPRAKNAKPIIRSYILPPPGGEAIRLVSSADQPYTVMLRVVDPPGSFAMFSFDPTTLNNTIVIPTGENIIIPVGQWQSVPLPPYSALYGRGSVSEVVVSVTGSPIGRSVEKHSFDTAIEIAA